MIVVPEHGKKMRGVGSSDRSVDLAASGRSSGVPVDKAWTLLAVADTYMWPTLICIPECYMGLKAGRAKSPYAVKKMEGLQRRSAKDAEVCS